MPEKILAAVVIVVAVSYLLATTHRWLAGIWFLGLALRWLAGVSESDRVPRWKRVLRRNGSVLLALALVTGYLVSPQATAGAASAAALAGLSYGVWWTSRLVWRFRHHRTWLRPLHLAACDVAMIPRSRPPGSWIEVSGDRRDATLALPPGWPADERDKQRLVSIVTAKLGMDTPKVTWRLAGPRPTLELSPCETPPPALLTYRDHLVEAVDRAGPDEIVTGIGNGGTIVKASLATDSPHLAINMGTGGGKSALAAFWLVQELRRGAIAMVLDAKWFSHPWLFKDEHGEYSQLPNVAYLSTPAQIHDGMVWLGRELDRRNQVARRAVTASGRMLGNVGPRLFILAEELNFVMPQLKQHWAEIRESDDVKKSPALTGFGGVAFAGRAVKRHLMLVGQMLTAEVTGSRDNSVKENVGITALARYGPPGWNTAVGKNVPMPPAPSVLGRVQLVTASGVRETQTPKDDFLLYRQLAMSGTVTLCPAGMPGAVTGVPDAPQLVNGGPEQPVVFETRPSLGHPAGLVTLSEAVDLKIVSRSLHALRKASQRDPNFPRRQGMRGLAAEYEPVELSNWDAGSR